MSWKYKQDKYFPPLSWFQLVVFPHRNRRQSRVLGLQECATIPGVQSYFIYVCVYAHVPACTLAYMPQVSSLLRPRVSWEINHRWSVRLGSKHLYLLNHFPGPGILLKCLNCKTGNWVYTSMGFDSHRCNTQFYGLPVFPVYPPLAQFT